MATQSQKYSYESDRPNLHNPADGSYNWDYTQDEEYLAALEKYKDHPLLANLTSMASLKGQGTLGFWEGIGDWLGITHHGQQYLDQSYQNYRTELANVIQQLEATTYNSPQEQVKREQAAGINTDMQSGGISPGNADDVEQPLSPGAALPTPDSSVISALPGAMLSFLQTGFSVAQNIQAMRSRSLENGVTELKLNSDASNLAMDEIIKMLDINLEDNDSIDRALRIGRYYKDEDQKQGEMKGLIDAATLSEATTEILSNKYAKRAFKHYRGMINSNSAPVREKFAGMLKNYVNDRYSSAKIKGLPDYDEDFSEMVGKIGEITNKYYTEFIEIQKRFNEAQAKTAESNAKSAEAKAGYDTQFYGTTGETGDSLGVAAGKAAHKNYNAEEAQKEFESKENEMWNDITRFLDKKDTWWSAVLKFLVPIFRSYLHNMRTSSFPQLPAAPAAPQSPQYPENTTNFVY